MLQSGLSNSFQFNSSSTFLFFLMSYILFLRIKMNTERRWMHTRLIDNGEESGSGRQILNLKDLVLVESNA